MSTDRPKVAFTAGLGLNGKLGPFNFQYSLVYRRVMTNIGNAYSPSTGNLFNKQEPVPGHVGVAFCDETLDLHLDCVPSFTIHVGIFTAPVSGVYFFRFTVGTESESFSSGAILYKNKQQVINIFTHDRNGKLRHYSSGAVLQLEKGDTVQLKLETDYQIYDDEHNHNMFSGFMLFTM